METLGISLEELDNYDDHNDKPVITNHLNLSQCETISADVSRDTSSDSLPISSC